MDHKTYPILAGGAIADVSLDDSPLYAPMVESARSMLSSTLPHVAHFETYLAGMVAKKQQRPRKYSLSPSPSSSERSSMEDPRLEDSPSQATITQAAVRVEPAPRLKTKRSFGQALKAFKTPSLDFPETLKKRRPPHQHSPKAIGANSHMVLNAGSGSDEESGFDSIEDVPRMQAYDQCLLESDYEIHLLLCQLGQADSPTFQDLGRKDLGRKPPTDVLDLGCGAGFWVVRAANLWQSSNILGLDLTGDNEVGKAQPRIHIESAATNNVTWRRINFIDHPLPFQSNSFDFVRMANLTIHIPTTRWMFVLTEARRVLRPGGRLEVINDDVFFPAILPRPTRGVQRANSNGSSVQRITPHRFEKPLPPLPSERPNNHKGHSRTSSETDFSANSTIAAHLETIYQNMLLNRFDVSPRPHGHMERMLDDVFGSDHVTPMQQFDLAVPSRELIEQCDNLDPSSRRKGSSHTRRASEDEKRGKGSLRIRSPRTSGEYLRADSSVLELVTPKARQLLFGDGSSRTPSWKTSGPYQPPGLVLLPATFIPCNPVELELHACKHMNTLLRSKGALSKFVAAHQDRHGNPIVSQRELDSYLWDYECFRRKRFNWPQYVTGLQLDNDLDEAVTLPSAKIAKRTTSIDERLCAGAQSIHVRTIRVYGATKVIPS